MALAVKVMRAPRRHQYALKMIRPFSGTIPVAALAEEMTMDAARGLLADGNVGRVAVRTP